MRAGALARLHGKSCACVSRTGPHGKGSARFVSCVSWPHNGARHERSGVMSGVRVLVGTRKGAFILTADGKRERWNVSGPHFAGWEIYHVKGSLADPNRLYASQSSGWFGQVIQRSCDGGKTWETPGGGMGKTPDGMPTGESNKFVYDATPESGKPLTTPQWYDGTQHPWEFKRDRKSTRLNSSHGYISYAVFCLKKKKQQPQDNRETRVT